MATINDLAKQFGQWAHVHETILAEARENKGMISVANAIAEQRKRDEKLLVDITRYNALEKTRKEIKSIANTAYLQELRAANRTVTGIVESARKRESILHPYFQIASTHAAARAHEAERRWSAVAMRTSRMASLSLSSLAVLERFKPHNIGRRIGMPNVLRDSTSENLIDLASSYSGVMSELRDAPSSLSPYTSTIADQAPVEMAAEASLIESISESEVVESESDTTILEFGDTLDVSRLLGSRDERYLQPLEGARAALASGNPDRARHVTTSIRELFTSVLHDLAPTGLVSDWSTDPSHFHQGRPTRRARLLYICRAVSAAPLERFITSDVTAVIDLCDALNSGTHVLESQLDDAQLSALIARMESLMYFLFRLDQDTADSSS